MKAVGAKERDILSIFVIESGLLGGIGGIIGFCIGAIMAYLITSFGINTAITPILAFGSIFFSIIIGVGAGYIPAKRAAKLNPVQAFR
jgi:putative ABC transport system permease protein